MNKQTDNNLVKTKKKKKKSQAHLNGIKYMEEAVHDHDL